MTEDVKATSTIVRPKRGTQIIHCPEIKNKEKVHAFSKHEHLRIRMQLFGMNSYIFFGVSLTSLISLVAAWHCFLVEPPKTRHVQKVGERLLTNSA